MSLERRLKFENLAMLAPGHGTEVICLALYLWMVFLKNNNIGYIEAVI